MRTVDSQKWKEIRIPGRRFGEQYRVWFPCDAEAWGAWARAYIAGDRDGITFFRSSRYAEVSHLEVPGEPEPYFIKHFLVRNMGDIFKGIIRHSRGRREWLGGEWMMGRQFEVPEAVCVLERCRFGIALDSVMVMKPVQRAVHAYRWVAPLPRGMARNRVEKRAFIRALAEEVARMHRLGVVHGDMDLTNMLCERTDGGYRFVWMDNERTRRYARIPVREWQRNLVQLNMARENLTVTDRMYFMKVYSEAMGLTPPERRRLTRAVLAWTQRRWREKGWL